MEPDYDPEPGYPQTKKAAAAIRHAVLAALPGKIVFLSTVGAHFTRRNLLNNANITEEMLRTLPVPIGLLRAAWFMENASWDVESARGGVISSFLQPLDHAIPMVATADIASTAVDLLVNETFSGVRIVELEGPQRYSANDIAAGFAGAVGRKVQVQAVPRESWQSLFLSQGMKNPIPRIRMLDRFNEGWIDFEGREAQARKGSTPLEQVLRSLVGQAK